MQPATRRLPREAVPAGSGAPVASPAAGHDAFLEHLPQGVLVLDRCLRVAFVNGRAREMLGPAAVPGARLSAVLRAAWPGTVPPVHLPRSYLARGTNGPADVARGDGVIAFELRPVPGRGWIASLEDVTARRREAARARDLAGLDALTGLPNRRAFHERLAEHAAGGRAGGAAAILAIDLDGFKTVNDTLGHGIGDALLRTVAERLRAAVREGDVLARLGGDEFAVVQLGAALPEGADTLARRLVELLGRAYLVEGHLINVGASVGVALLAPGEVPEEALRFADLALYRAKADGRGTHRFYEAGMNAAMQARRELEIDLRKALLLREFEVHFQPQMNLARGAITGFEALLRWRHPERGMVPPLDFIPLAEGIGLIVPIGAWVLRTACREAARWPGEVTVAVNLSPAQFRGPGLVETVVSALAASGLAPARLELEITESVLLQDNEATLATMHRLRALGVRVSMDDFGTGYSSLSYLRSFPFDKIKIDRSFVRDMASNPDCGAIVRAIAGLGVSLGMTTTAEGVETAEQMDRIRAEGCTEVQGYLVSRPVPAAQVAALLA